MILTGILIIALGLFVFSETKYKIFGIIIISIGLNFFANYYKLQNLKESNQMTNWKHTLPLKLYEDLKSKYDMPIIRINKKDGFVIWKKNSKQPIYDEILLKDEEIQNDDEKMELLCLYLNIKLYIPPKLLNKILNVSHRISYNKGKYIMTIHTNSINAGNKILLKVFQLIHKNKITSLKKQIEINKSNHKLDMENTNYRE